ncbi:MAG: site-2 protease family protein, partial [Nitrospinaceae bacterium]
PLDGGSVLKGLVSHETAVRIGQFDRYGALIILAVILLDNFAGTHILSFVLWKPIMYTTELLTQEMFPILKQVLMILPR